MLDFTKNIRLSKEWQRKYLMAKACLYFVFIIVTLFVFYRVLFPSRYFNYFFNVKSASQNTIINPRNQQDVPLDNKPLKNEGAFKFDSALVGSFSNAIVTMTLKKDSPSIKNGTVFINKGFQSFFYPLGEPAGFKNGTLLFDGENYFIVSQETLRKFPTLNVAQELGFAKNMFLPVSSQELSYNKKGSDIIKNTYPDDTVFKIADTYYQLKNQELVAFVSEKAFLTNYDASQVITKDNDFLNKYPLSENLLGFADGTLVSSPQSVFFLSGNKSYPIDNSITFESMGFFWEDVIPASSDELGMYERQKIYDIHQPHPDGTIFQEKQSGKYFLIQNGKRHELKSQNIAASYLKKHAIIVDSEDSSRKLPCDFKKQLLPVRTYSCDIDITKLASIIGNDYQFQATVGNNIGIDNISVTFKKSFEFKNLKDSLSGIKQQLIQNYYGAQ